MNDSALITTGIVGAVIAAICCATPILVIALGTVGLSALTGFGVYKRRQDAANVANKTTSGI